MGGMYWVNNYQLYCLFADPSNRALYGHASSIQADHLLSIFYSFVRKHVGVDCWGSWFNILGHLLSLRLSSFVSFCIVSLFSQYLCSLFLEDARHLLSLFRSFWHSTSLLCSFLIPQILLQNFVHSSAFSTPFNLLPVPFYSVSIFFWLRSKITLCLNCSILCSYILNFALFPSMLCFNSSITVFNPFFLTLYFSYSSFIFFFFFNPNSPFKS